MKLKNNKKGFTLVELVIVIAVIAILAAVLIPTFTSVIDNANRASAQEEAKALQTQILMLADNGNFDDYVEKMEEHYQNVNSDTDACKLTTPIVPQNLYGNNNAASEVKFSDVVSNVQETSNKNSFTFTAKAGTTPAYIEYKVGKYTVQISASEIAVEKDNTSENMIVPHQS